LEAQNQNLHYSLIFSYTCKTRVSYHGMISAHDLSNSADKMTPTVHPVKNTGLFG